MKKLIYLDNAATTKIHSEVLKAMNLIDNKNYGNPSSPNQLGEEALNELNKARGGIANIINSKPWEIIFTSGATEANNLILFGLTKSYTHKKKILVSTIEHSSIYESAKILSSLGIIVEFIPVNSEGLIDYSQLAARIDSQTLLVSIIHGNNEFGTIQDLTKIARICKDNGALFHTDAVQSFTKEKIDVKKIGIDALSASAHKIGGPKGVGFLYLREDLIIEPLIYGGPQERGIRGGTENVAGAVGLAKAAKIYSTKNWNNVSKLRDYCIKEIEKIGGTINGSKTQRLPNNIHVSFRGIDSEMLVNSLSDRGIMCSARSACTSKQKEDNRILRAIGLSNESNKSSIRFSLSIDTTKKELNILINELKEILNSVVKKDS